MGHEKRDCIALIGLVIVGLQRAQTKIASAPEGLSATRVPVPTKVAGHWWINGRIFACHVGDPGPIPGQCKDSLLLSRMRACTISKNAQTSGAETIFVWAQPWRDHSFLRCGYLCSETPTRLFRVYQQAVEGHAAGHFLYLQPLQSTRHAFIFI